MKIKSDIQIRRFLQGIVTLCLLLFCLSVKVHATEDYQVTEVQMQGNITTDSALNVRLGPGKEYDVITMVKNDTVLMITGQTDNGWYQIELDGQTGYVSGKYVETQELPGTETETIGEPEEGYRGLQQSPYMIKIVAIGAVILVVLIMLTLTLKGMRRDEDDEDDGEEEDDEDDTDINVEEEDEGSMDDVERAVRKETRERIRKREYIIREEDYRVDIDPSFFEELEPIEQPDMVTGYLERKKIQEAIGASEFIDVPDMENEITIEQTAENDKQKELDMAMEKLNELQKEIERLRNGN